MNNLEKTKTLQEKLSDKIKESLGDMITEEDLKPLVDRSIEQMLMEDRTIETDSYSKRIKPPLLTELIQVEVQIHCQKIVPEWLANHPEIMEKAFQEVFDEGIFQTIQKVMDNKIYGPLIDFQNKIGEIFTRNNIT